MNKRRMAAFEAGLLFTAMLAGAATRTNLTRIRVLSAESRSVILDDSGVPKNCDGLNYDAYCHSSQAAQVTNTLLVQEDDGPPFRVTCAVDSKWSKCALLPEGESFDARKEKHGLTVYYQDDYGKPRKQLYALLSADAKAGPTPAVAPAAAAPVAPHPALIPDRGTAPAPPAPASTGIPRQTVKCSVTSTPAGAEITLDGRFVGSTPSVLALPPGTHVVIVSTPGFAPWRRDLTVSPGSELTVSAVLQKAR